MLWASSLAPYQVSEALFHIKGGFGCVPYNTLFFLVNIMVVIPFPATMGGKLFNKAVSVHE